MIILIVLTMVTRTTVVTLLIIMRILMTAVPLLIVMIPIMTTRIILPTITRVWIVIILIIITAGSVRPTQPTLPPPIMSHQTWITLPWLIWPSPLPSMQLVNRPGKVHLVLRVIHPRPHRHCLPTMPPHPSHPHHIQLLFAHR